MTKQKISKNKLSLIIGISLLIISLGISYAGFYYSFQGENSVIDKEYVEIQFLESNSEIIDLENALPMDDNQGKTQEKSFNF